MALLRTEQTLMPRAPQVSSQETSGDWAIVVRCAAGGPVRMWVCGHVGVENVGQGQGVQTGGLGGKGRLVLWVLIQVLSIPVPL